MTLSPLHAAHKRATINQTTLFNISDEAAFGEFTAVMITQSNFTWRLKSDNLKVNALKFPVAKGIHFDKKLTLKGINNFAGNVVLKDFQVRFQRRKLSLLFHLSLLGVLTLRNM